MYMGKKNFYLPSFHMHYTTNTYFIKLLINSPEVFYSDLSICSLYDSFPGAYWNGGRPYIGFSDQNEMEFMVNSINSLGVAIRYTFTNSLIDEHLIHDPYCNLMMDIANNGMNEVLVNHPLLEDYLREKYPNFKYISSTTKCVLDVDEVNKECEKYYLTILDYRKNTDKDFHKKLAHKDKIELLLNAHCSPECAQRKEHYEYIAKYQQFKENGCSFHCNTFKKSFYDVLKWPSVIKVEDLYNYYLNAGFHHFKIEGRHQHPMDLIESYVYYMIKPEHRDEVRYDAVKNLWVQQ